MAVLDVIAEPFYLLYGVGAFIILVAIGAVVTATMIIFALIQRFLKKKDQKKDEK